MKAEDRPLVETPFHTQDLPPLPQRDRRFPVSGWIDAPESARRLGDGLPGEPGYVRRIGRWLLWRAGPATGAEARYLAVDSADLSLHYRFDLSADGDGAGLGPDGQRHERFRSWKEALRDSEQGSLSAST